MRQNRRVTILEGNRRLTALRGLADPELRETFDDKRWRQVDQADVELPEEILVHLVSKREDVTAILGYRHITGIEAWDPYAQARYIAELVDERDWGFDQVAEQVGRSKTEVKSYYRNYSIVQQAEEDGHVDDLGRITQEFGVWTRAMTSQNLRAFIGAPAPGEVMAGEWPLDPGREDEFSELLVWIFGQPRTPEQQEAGEQSLEGRAIGDSRELNRLGKAIADKGGLAALRKGMNLEKAEAQIGNPADRLRTALAEAREALERAAQEKPESLSEGMADDLNACSKAIESISERYGDRASS